MLKVFYGNDTHTIRCEAHAVAAASAGDAPYTTLESEQYEAGQLTTAVGETSLFGGQEVYLIDTPVGALAEEVETLLTDMAASPNTFVVIEGTLLAPAKKRYTQVTDDVTEYKAAAAERFDVFALAEALARKDKKSLWLLLQQARQAGLSAEEIIGTLWWQIKSLRLAAVTRSAAEAGMKDYPYRKAQSALVKFAPGQLLALSHSLLTVYHQGHAGEVDTFTALEQWCLEL